MWAQATKMNVKGTKFCLRPMGRVFMHLCPKTYCVLFLYWEKMGMFICMTNEYLLISIISADNLIALLKLLLHIFV